MREGDYFDGERCELGLNDHRSSPVAIYREGQRLLTYVSFRLPKRFPLHQTKWQIVMQMKQTQPADSGGGRPVLALHVLDGRWQILHTSRDETTVLWTAPATRRQWTRFAFDITYSTSPAVGSMQVFVDLNGDGDALDARERSRRFRLRTLKPEGPGGIDDGIGPGEPIPSHLRVGLYHDSEYNCQQANCAVHVDGVAVYPP